MNDRLCITIIQNAFKKNHPGPSMEIKTCLSQYLAIPLKKTNFVRLWTPAS